MKIEFLYFKECPGYQSALSLLEQLLIERGIHAPIEKIEIVSQEQAIQYRFLGSPSIRINDKDIEGREEDLEYGLKCRIYPESGSGIPPEALLRKALQRVEEHP